MQEEQGQSHAMPHEYQPQSMLSENDQVFVKDGERCWFVKLNEIRLFESVGNYAKGLFRHQ